MRLWYMLAWRHLYKAGFAKKINVADNEMIPAVYPIWLWRRKKSAGWQDNTGVARSNHRRQWSESFFNGNFATPLSIEEASVYAKPLEMVSIAPSASNKQPWRMLKDKIQNYFICFYKGLKIILKSPLESTCKWLILVLPCATSS